MKGLCISVILVAIGLPFAKPATAETVSVSNDPIELVRTLRTVQDKIVQGSRGAYASQRKLIAAVTDQLLSAKPEVWRDVKYLRAGIVFTLNGGDTRVARNVLGLGDLPAMEERILKGALAYAEGRTTEASEQLSGIDALSLDSSIASHVALAQGVILARDEPQRAVSRLEIARLLAPGTLVEEAALRREIMLVSALEDFDRFETLTARYMRRYSRSIYAVGFHRQLAAEIANSKNWDDPQRLARLDSMMEGLDAPAKKDVYLAMAQAGILKGQVGLTRFAAHHANSLGGDAAAATPQARVYEAAALIATDDFEAGLAQLQRVDRAALTPQDVEILDSALKIARQIRSEPTVATPTSPPPVEGASPRARDLAATGARVVTLAQATMARIDGMLSKRAVAR